MRSAGVALDVTPRNSAQARKHANESTLALKPRADITRSPTQGYQWPHKDLWPPKIILKNEKKNSSPSMCNPRSALLNRVRHTNRNSFRSVIIITDLLFINVLHLTQENKRSTFIKRRYVTLYQRNLHLGPM